MQNQYNVYQNDRSKEIGIDLRVVMNHHMRDAGVATNCAFCQSPDTLKSQLLALAACQNKDLCSASWFV
jgi:hypothetical protein